MDAFESGLEGLLPRSQWSRRGFVMTSLITGFALSMQPVSAETITTDTNGLEAGEVKVPVADGSIPAYRAMPAQGGPFPTVLVVQEVFGVHEHIKDICRRLAKAGYYAIAPELYARQGDPSKYTDIPTLVSEIVVKVPADQVMSDLDATEAYAKSSGKADTAKLAVTGFCWGGWATWMYAAHNPNLKAAVAWYGPPARPYKGKSGDVTSFDLAKDVKIPFLGLFGELDQNPKPEDAKKFGELVKQAGNQNVEIVVYPGATHGFHADYRPSYRADAAKDGWTRMLAWFKDHGVA